MIKIDKEVLLYVDSEDIVNGHFDIPSTVIEIGYRALYEKQLKSIIIPSGVIKIGNEAFYSNCITSVIIPNSVKTIGSYAFAINQLESIIIPDGVITIEYGAFSMNQIRSLVIPNSVKTIGPSAFISNPLNSITTSCEVKISDNAFEMSYIKDINVVLKSGVVTLYKNDLVKIGNYSSKIIYLAKWKELYKNDINSYNNLRLEIIGNLEPTRENANILKQRMGIYNKFREEGNIPIFDVVTGEDFFKACCLLGLFSDDYQEAQEYISNLYKRLSKDDIHNIFTIIKLTTINNKEKIKLIKKALEDQRFIAYPEYVARINNSYSQIKKWIGKNYKEIIYARIKPKINEILRKVNLNDSEIKELEKLKTKAENMSKSIEEITLDDVIYYINNNQFEIRDNNKGLEKIVYYLRGISQEEFDKLQDLYEKSKGVIKNLEQTEDVATGGYTYMWTKSDNPINLALGYIVRCCAKIDGVGEDIMVQSMINPNVQNLVILDENKFVVAKATAYYNKNKNYILFNNVEAMQNANKEQIREALKRAVKDIVIAYEQKGKNPPEIRIGMLRNDAFTNDDIEVVYGNDLLSNYSYSGYDGDANSEEGQGILFNSKAVEEAKRSI
ncbi:MAG TPA: leucine-rich repeat protein [Bacilli bacterium]|nr:leucine-rich repeat protein [Bacilli bacterium]